LRRTVARFVRIKTAPFVALIQAPPPVSRKDASVGRPAPFATAHPASR
jgi:hypothetical protein